MPLEYILRRCSGILIILRPRDLSEKCPTLQSGYVVVYIEFPGSEYATKCKSHS